MLRNIPKSLSPDLVKVLMQMGHGDEIVLGDANFPAHSHSDQVLRADGLHIPDLLRDILTLMPLDRYSDYQVGLMSTAGDDPRPDIWNIYEKIWNEAGKEAGFVQVKMFERNEFYRHTGTVYAALVTGETALYGNVILRKGAI